MGPACGEPLLKVDDPDYPVLIPAGMPQRLARLAKVFKLVWTTSWEERANRLLAPTLSLRPLAFIQFPDGPVRSGRSHKLPAVKKYVGKLPLAWVDDEVSVSRMKTSSSL